jgi:hypothetical protein
MAARGTRWQQVAHDGSEEFTMAAKGAELLRGAQCEAQIGYEGAQMAARGAR